ncbi:MAG: ATP-binding protein [Bacteroidales bacterium]|nr:ATP-binding protein [Bacteroidales bacterium]
MAKNNIIGRVQEIRLLDDLVASNKAEFVALYGRRRVGKTYLLQQYFDGKLDFYYTGMFQTEKNVQLDRFENHPILATYKTLC